MQQTSLLPPTPQGLRVDNVAVPFLGTWRGFEYEPTREWRRAGLAELLGAVRERRPQVSAEIRQRERACRQALLQLRLRQTAVRELLAFEGPMPELGAMIASLQRFFPAERPQEFRRFRQALLELRSARCGQIVELLKGGALGFDMVPVFDHTNRVVEGYLDTIQARQQGTATANETLEIKTVIVGAGYAAPGVADTVLGHQIGSGVVPGEELVTGYQTTWISQFGLADNNGATTTIAAITDTTHFQLTSGTGFQVGDRIEVQATGGTVKTTILALSGGVNVTTEDVITGMALTNPIIQIWGESGLKGNADGNTMLTHSRFSDGGYTKTNQKSILVESAITQRSVAS